MFSRYLQKQNENPVCYRPVHLVARDLPKWFVSFENRKRIVLFIFIVVVSSPSLTNHRLKRSAVGKFD